MSFSQGIKDGLKCFAGSSFFLRVQIFVGLGGCLPEFDDSTELAFIIKHVVVVPDLAVIAVLNVNPLARFAGLSEELWGKGMTVDFFGGQFGTGKLAECGEDVGEIDQVLAEPEPRAAEMDQCEECTRYWRCCAPIRRAALQIDILERPTALTTQTVSRRSF